MHKTLDGGEQAGGALSRWWREFVVAPLRRADDEARAYLDSPAARRLDGKALTILITVAVMLTLIHYLCMQNEAANNVARLRAVGLDRFADRVQGFLSPSDRGHELQRLTWWAGGVFVFYFVIPALIVRLVFRERLADYGVKLRGAFRDGWVYLVMFAVVGPLVLIVSRDQHFQETYPFYHPARGALWPTFWAWEALYALQFFALEFFFRGFLVQGLRHRFGAYVIPVMTVPYCMIHFDKPLPEVFASIIAGLALGFMSLKTRSILLGFAIHVSVALSMDFTSLWRKGFFD